MAMKKKMRSGPKKRTARIKSDSKSEGMSSKRRKMGRKHPK